MAIASVPPGSANLIAAQMRNKAGTIIGVLTNPNHGSPETEKVKYATTTSPRISAAASRKRSRDQGPNDSRACLETATSKGARMSMPTVFDRYQMYQVVQKSP